MRLRLSGITASAKPWSGLHEVQPLFDALQAGIEAVQPAIHPRQRLFRICHADFDVPHVIRDLNKMTRSHFKIPARASLGQH